jgi:hypothetical protein
MKNRRKPIPRPTKPLQRKTGLARTGFTRRSDKVLKQQQAFNRRPIKPKSEKRVREDKEDAKQIAETEATFERCAICHWPNGKPGYMRAIQTHHLRKRKHRERNCRDNLQPLCGICHGVLHGGVIVIDGVRFPNLHDGHALQAQLERLPDLDMELLNRIQPSKFAPTELPEFYAEQRRKNRRPYE